MNLLSKVPTLKSVLSSTLHPLPGDQNELFHLAATLACLSGVMIQSSRAEGVLPVLAGGALGWLSTWVLRVWMTPSPAEEFAEEEGMQWLRT